VARGIRDFQGDESGFRSWIFTIAHRRMADYWEERKRDPSSYLQPADLEERRARDDPEQSVVDAMSAQAAARRIAAALSPDQAEVILLRLLGGLDLDQVARIVGKRVGAVRVLQHRALRKLSKEISLEGVTG
jgi:RNA polymerase sigma factor (sigma-70 family)